MKILGKTAVSSFTVTMQSDMLLGLHILPVCLDNWIITFSILVTIFKIVTIDNAFVNIKTDPIYHMVSVPQGHYGCTCLVAWIVKTIPDDRRHVMWTHFYLRQLLFFFKSHWWEQSCLSNPGVKLCLKCHIYLFDYLASSISHSRAACMTFTVL